MNKNEGLRRSFRRNKRLDERRIARVPDKQWGVLKYRLEGGFEVRGWGGEYETVKYEYTR